jgi:hypothetical protein
MGAGWPIVTHAVRGPQRSKSTPHFGQDTCLRALWFNPIFVRQQQSADTIPAGANIGAAFILQGDSACAGSPRAALIDGDSYLLSTAVT